MRNDSSGPFYDSATSSQINYNPLSILNSVNTGLPYFASGVSVLLAYGRFYAGSDIADHAHDVETALWFLNKKIGVSENLIGIQSGTNKFTQSNLTQISTHFFLAHDEWDTLVPYQHTLALLIQLNNPSNLMYHHNHSQNLNYTNAVISHTQLTEGMPNEAVLMWGYIYQLDQILPVNDQKIIFYNSASFIAQFNHVLSLRGIKSTSHYTNVLKLLCKNNLLMFDYSAVLPGVSGPQLLNYMLTTYVAGWSSTETTVCDKLQTQSPF